MKSGFSRPPQGCEAGNTGAEPEHVYLSRRQFMTGAVALSAAAFLTACGSRRLTDEGVYPIPVGQLSEQVLRPGASLAEFDRVFPMNVIQGYLNSAFQGDQYLDRYTTLRTALEKQITRQYRYENHAYGVSYDFFLATDVAMYAQEQLDALIYLAQRDMGRAFNPLSSAALFIVNKPDLVTCNPATFIVQNSTHEWGASLIFPEEECFTFEMAQLLAGRGSSIEVGAPLTKTIPCVPFAVAVQCAINGEGYEDYIHLVADTTSFRGVPVNFRPMSVTDYSEYRALLAPKWQY